MPRAAAHWPVLRKEQVHPCPWQSTCDPRTEVHPHGVSRCRPQAPSIPSAGEACRSRSGLCALCFGQRSSEWLAQCYNTRFDVTLNRRTLSLCSPGCAWRQFFTEENKDRTLAVSTVHSRFRNVTRHVHPRPGKGPLAYPHLTSGWLVRWVLTFFFSAFYLPPYAFLSPPRGSPGSGRWACTCTPGAPPAAPALLLTLASS